MARKKNWERMDTHHIFFMRRDWNKGNVKKLRFYKYCMIKLPQQTIHREIHENMRGIAPPKDKNAELVLKQLQFFEKYGAISETDSLEKRLQVLIGLFKDSEPATAYGLQRQLKIVRDYNSRPH